MMNKIFTRKQYMNRECSHHTYYSQPITEQTKRAILNVFPIGILIQSAQLDSSFNTKLTPLKKWDLIPTYKDSRIWDSMESVGYSKSDSVCILKAAAKNLVWESGNIIHPNASGTLNFMSEDDSECPANIFEGEGRSKVIRLCERLAELLRGNVTDIDSREAGTLKDLKKVIWRKDGKTISAELYSDQDNPNWFQFQMIVIPAEHQRAGDIVG